MSCSSRGSFACESSPDRHVEPLTRTSQVAALEQSVDRRTCRIPGKSSRQGRRGHRHLAPGENRDGIAAGRPVEVCRVREPDATDSRVSVREYRGMKEAIGAVAVPGSSCFLINERLDGPKGSYQELKSLDVANNRVLWSQRWESEVSTPLEVVTLGKFFSFGPRGGGKEESTLGDTLNGKVRKSFGAFPGRPGPDAAWFVRRSASDVGLSLHNADDQTVLELGIDQQIPTLPVISADGIRVAWGNPDGSVMVADLEMIRARLSDEQLSW
jgi:hypothetical protein